MREVYFGKQQTSTNELNPNTCQRSPSATTSTIKPLLKRNLVDLINPQRIDF
jgi:hypothetical protein